MAAGAAVLGHSRCRQWRCSSTTWGPKSAADGSLRRHPFHHERRRHRGAISGWRPVTQSTSEFPRHGQRVLRFREPASVNAPSSASPKIQNPTSRKSIMKKNSGCAIIGSGENIGTILLYKLRTLGSIWGNQFCGWVGLFVDPGASRRPGGHVARRPGPQKTKTGFSRGR